MRNLLQATDRDRLVAYLRGPLLRDVAVGGRRMMALAEADGAEGTSFCAAPANARAAELLVQPEIRDQDPAFADGVLDFVMAMAETPMPCRRAAVGGMEVIRDDPRDFEVLTPFHRFAGDLSVGILRQQMRGAGEATPPVLHTGNLVEFRIGRRRSGVDAEDTIRDFAFRRSGDSVVLSHESRISGSAGLFRPRQVEAGTLRYDYEIQAGSPLLRLTVTFTAGGTALTRLRVSSAMDQLGAGGLDLAEAMVATSATAWRGFGPPKAAGLTLWSEGTVMPHLAIGTTGWPAGAPVLHLRPAAPDKVMSVKAIAARPGALHWVILRHGPVDLAPGAALVVREDRLLAPGTPPDAAARAMAGPAASGLDLDPMPPEGAALNAVAAHLLMARRGAYRVPVAPARMAALEAWLERHLAALAAGQPALIDLGFATLAAEARQRMGAQDRMLADLVGRLLAAQAASGAFHDPDGRAGGLAGHAVTLLALARALPHLDPSPLAVVIGRALEAISPGPVAYHDGGRMTQLEGLVLEGGAAGLLSGHAEAIGLVARAAGAVVLAAQARPGVLPAAQVTRAQTLHRQMVVLIRPLVRPRGPALEVAPSPLGGAANPAGQAAVALGLLAVDQAILRSGPPVSGPPVSGPSVAA